MKCRCSEKKNGSWMRNFILYWLDTYATFTRFTTCGQGATPRCDAEVRRQGATPTCPRPRMCVYCLLCMSSRRQSLSRRAVCGVGNDEAQSKKKQRSNHTHITMNHLQSSPPPGLGMMKPNRRRNRDQTTHTALNSKLKQLN